ncbi:homoserine kinase [Rhodoferax sp.]|uniref:homoserine kinase n=1 Tax=Rhodoferax sp. TaxID=50421 RepID=UPI00261E60D6|nr:homoserine kinase [Rhodoferax sp.]MDD2809999.1 homoserine kinase [Rhodoferax sp.]
MAVYTEVSLTEAQALFDQLQLGQLTQLKGCAGGIENTNYFATAMHHGQLHEHVLTLFERLSFAQLPFYLQLMKHLAQHGVAVPEPSANADGALVFELKGKPAAVVNKLRGASALAPTPEHCAQVGAMLARMHLAGRSFATQQPNLRGLSWWNDTVPVVLPFLTAPQKALITQELAFQNQLSTLPDYAALPRGPIHADLFRDNVLFDSVNGAPVLSGFFDFYFAGVDAWVFDLAVCLNDWCIDLPTGAHHAPRAQAFVAAYQQQRPLTAAERALLPAMLRAAALRFWLSRLWDLHLPREASMLQAHDPSHFERVLTQRVQHALDVDALVASA